MSEVYLALGNTKLNCNHFATCSRIQENSTVCLNIKICLELEIDIQKQKNIMKLLMLPSKDSKTGKGHNLDKFCVWYPKWNTELCFPYKNLPKFFQTAAVRTGGRLYSETRVVCRPVRACLPNSSVPWSCGTSSMCSCEPLMNMHQ